MKQEEACETRGGLCNKRRLVKQEEASFIKGVCFIKGVYVIKGVCVLEGATMAHTAPPPANPSLVLGPVRCLRQVKILNLGTFLKIKK